ncbi:hypothetical protein KUC3_04900 [Alteromonas sp. KC3]|nr:hypothetical protein KUC3_04900 [Alteromonas sp. KC3]
MPYVPAPVIEKLAANMETLISTVVLISIPSFFAVRHFNEYGTFDDPKIWGRAEKIASLLFALYLGMILVLGKSGIYSFYEPVSTIRDPRFMFFFLFPSIGFGIAMFPRVAAEFSQNYLPMLQSDMLKYFSIYGWLIIVCLTLIIAV